MPLLNYRSPPRTPKKPEEEKLDYLGMIRGITPAQEQRPESFLDVARQVEPQAREVGAAPDQPVGTGTVLWEGIKSLPREIVAKGLTGIQGISGAEVVEPDWSDKFIAETERLREERFRKYDMGREVFPGFNVGDLAQLPSNLAYSISTLIPAVGAGVTAGLFTGGIGGWAAGAGVGGSAAYRMASGEIMRSYLKEMNQKKMQETGRGLTKAEETKLKADFDDKAQAYGAWEAIPEAIGGVGAGKIIANTVLGSAIKKAVGKDLATKLLTRAFGVYGSELTQEMVTEFGQRGVLAGTPVAEGQPLDPTKLSDYWQAFKDVAPQTFLITSILGPVGAGTAKAHERFIQDPRSRDRVKAAVVEDKYKDFDNPTMTGFAQLTTRVAQRYPEDADLQAAVGTIRQEFVRRVQGRFEGAHLTPEEGERLTEIAKTNPWMAEMGITEDTINKAIEGTWIDPDAQTQAPSVEPDLPETVEEISDKQRAVVEQRVRTKLGEADSLENLEEIINKAWRKNTSLKEYAKIYAEQIIAGGTFGIDEDMRAAVDKKVAELGSKQNVRSMYKQKSLISHYAKWKADQLGLPEKGVPMPGKKKGKKEEPTVPEFEPTEKSEITSRLIQAFKGPADERVTRLSPILEEASDEEMATALKEIGEMSVEEKEETGALALNSVIEKYYADKLEPEEELPTVQTEDGYTFYRQDDGTYTDHVDPEQADMTFESLQAMRDEDLRPLPPGKSEIAGKRQEKFLKEWQETFPEVEPEKEHWEMTPMEYSKSLYPEDYKALRSGIEGEPSDNRAWVAEAREHPEIIRKALAEGKVIPEEVMESYPKERYPEFYKEAPTKIEIPEGVTLTPEEQDVVDTVDQGRALDQANFYEIGMKGEIHEATGEEAPFEIGTLETPISHGLSEGYSLEDIAHFYITTRMAKEDKADWVEKARAGEGWLSQNMDRVETAYEEFQEDLEKEFEFLELEEAPKVEPKEPTGVTVAGAIQYQSGVSSIGDLRTALEAGQPVTVIVSVTGPKKIKQLSAKGMDTLAEHLQANPDARVLIDTGAFSAFTKDTPLTEEEFKEIYDRMERLLFRSRLKGDLRQVSIIAPDVIGDQEATHELQAAFVDTMRGFADRGATIMVPLQKGKMKPNEMITWVRNLFKDEITSDQLGIALPSNLKAWTTTDLRQGLNALGPIKNIHFLGKGLKALDIEQRMDIIRKLAPNANITFDATDLLTHMDEISGEARTQAIREIADERIEKFIEETPDLVDRILEGGFLSEAETRDLAKELGVSDPDSWVASNAEKKLGEAIDAWLLQEVLPKVTEARRAQTVQDEYQHIIDIIRGYLEVREGKEGEGIGAEARSKLFAQILTRKETPEEQRYMKKDLEAGQIVTGAGILVAKGKKRITTELNNKRLAWTWDGKGYKRKGVYLRRADWLESDETQLVANELKGKWIKYELYDEPTIGKVVGVSHLGATIVPHKTTPLAAGNMRDHVGLEYITEILKGPPREGPAPKRTDRIKAMPEIRIADVEVKEDGVWEVELEDTGDITIDALNQFQTDRSEITQVGKKWVGIIYTKHHGNIRTPFVETNDEAKELLHTLTMGRGGFRMAGEPKAPAAPKMAVIEDHEGIMVEIPTEHLAQAAENLLEELEHRALTLTGKGTRKEIGAAIRGRGGLKWDSMVKDYGADITNRLNAILGIGSIKKSGKIMPDEIAADFDFETEGDLVNYLLEGRASVPKYTKTLLRHIAKTGEAKGPKGGTTGLAVFARDLERHAKLIQEEADYYEGMMEDELADLEKATAEVPEGWAPTEERWTRDQDAEGKYIDHFFDYVDDGTDEGNWSAMISERTPPGETEKRFDYYPGTKEGKEDPVTYYTLREAQYAAEQDLGGPPDEGAAPEERKYNEANLKARIALDKAIVAKHGKKAAEERRDRDIEILLRLPDSEIDKAVKGNLSTYAQQWEEDRQRKERHGGRKQGDLFGKDVSSPQDDLFRPDPYREADVPVHVNQRKLAQLDRMIETTQKQYEEAKEAGDDTRANLHALNHKGLTTVRKFYMANKPIPENWQDEFGVRFLYDKFMARERGQRIFPEYKGRKATDAAIDGAYLLVEPEEYDFWLAKVTEEVGEENANRIDKEARRLYDTWTKKTDGILDKVVEFFNAGLGNLGWYRRSQEYIEETYGEDADMFSQFLAITSAGMKTTTNVTLAKNAYRQWKKGDTEFKNFRHAMRVNLQKAVQGVPWYDELYRPGRPGQIEPAFRKTGNFYKALRGDPDAVTVDIWVRRAFGYDMEKRLSAADYDFMESAIRNLATKWGVTPRDVQESIWMGAKLKEEGAAADIRGYEDLLAVHGVRMLREQKPAERLADMETFRQHYPTSNIRADDQGRLLIDYETNEGTKTLLIEWVDEIAEDADGLHLGWGQKELTEDQILAGRYNRSHIQLVLNESNEFDASHEVYHSFEDLFMSSKDVAIMRGTAKRWIRNGKLTAAKKGSEGNHEDRANLYAELWNAPQPNTAAGKIIEQMRDFIHMIANAVGLRTARGIVADARTGVLQQSLSGVGISPESYFIRSRTKKAPDTSVLEHILPERVKERFKAAKGLGQFDLKLRHRLKQATIEAGTAFIPGREYVVLNPKHFGKAIEILRHYREVPRWAKERARDMILEIISPGGLTTLDYDLFRTKLYLEDLLHDMEEGRPLENWKELVERHGEIAFGFQNKEEIEISLAKANEMVAGNRKVKQALDRREKRRKWIVDQIVENNLLPEATARSPHYVHHQVLAFAEMRRRVTTYTKGMRPEVPKRGYQMHRTGSVKDYNTEYVESEFEWMAHALAQIEAIKDHKDMVAAYDIKGSLARRAKSRNLKTFYEIVYDPEKAELDEEGGIVDPLHHFRRTIARAMDKLGKWAAEGKLIAEGELEYVVEELSESWQQRQADKEDFEDNPQMWTKVTAEKTPFFQYLSWLVANGHPGSRPAANILKAIRNRNKTIETTIKDNNKEFETAYTMMKKEAPIEGSEGYDIHLPKPGTAWFKTFSIHEKLYERFIKGALGRQLNESDFREVLARGKDMEIIVPIEVKSAMENVYGDPTPGETTIGKMAEQSLNWWKRYILLNPFRVVKYNVNNMSGDFDIAVAYDPGIMKYFVQAGRDLVKWHRRHLPGARMPSELYQELDMWLRDGVIGSGMTVHDIPDIGRGTGLEKIHKAIDGQKPHMIKRYWNTVKAFSTWRENILRLAAARRFQDRLAKGENLYGASNKEKVDAITDLDRKAGLLARELIGDYGAISEGGQWLRRKMIPFYSWMEINAPRYVRMMRNLPHEGQKKGQQVAMMSLVGAKKASALAIKASILFAAVQMWNQLMFPDEEDELGEVGRRQLHIILPPGRREDGTINTLRFQGALSDALAWFGAEDAPQDVRELVERRKTVWDFMAEAPVEFVNKLYQGVRPDLKVPMELATGRATWPDIGRGQPIRDRMEHVVRTFSLDPVYRRLIGRPIRGGSPEGRVMQDLMNIATYTADPGEIAYHSVRR
ncbi:MAG: DUF7178 family protein, partial [Planctomycetota bacterium]